MMINLLQDNFLEIRLRVWIVKLQYNVEFTQKPKKYYFRLLFDLFLMWIFFIGNNKPSKSIPPALDLSRNDDSSQGILAEFAFIATGPQSPLVQEVYGFANEADSPCDPRDIVSSFE
jgi:hypothetical protein